jgi:phage gp37-like protein
MVNTDFDFVVGALEDGIRQLLEFRYRKSDANPDGYLKTGVGSYAGELDEKNLRNAIESLSGNLPLMLVSYGQGVDQMSPATSPAFGEPRSWRHTCIFTVMVLDNNARGEVEQRRGAVGDAGAYKMIADVYAGLSGVSFAWRPPAGDEPAKVVRLVPNRPKAATDVALNLEPLRPDGIDYVARLKGLTAYAVHFETYFNWIEPDRRAADGTVEELVFEVTPLGGLGQRAEGGPGVILE